MRLVVGSSSPTCARVAVRGIELARYTPCLAGVAVVVACIAEIPHTAGCHAVVESHFSEVGNHGPIYSNILAGLATGLPSPRASQAGAVANSADIVVGSNDRVVVIPRWTLVGAGIVGLIVEVPNRTF